MRDPCPRAGGDLASNLPCSPALKARFSAGETGDSQAALGDGLLGNLTK